MTTQFIFVSRQVDSSRVDFESIEHSPDFDAMFRQRRKRERAERRRKARRLVLPGLGDSETDTVADPEEVSSYARKRKEAYDEYFSKDEKPGRRAGDRSMALPQCDDLQILANTFGASTERLTQALELKRQGLDRKAKRLILCNRIGHRVNCTGHEAHKFFQPFGCHGRYCQACGPAWFREKFVVLLAALEPVVEHILDEGLKCGRPTVIAKIDFTVPNTGEMPEPDFVRKFHREMHDFWGLLGGLCRIRRDHYGVGGNDELGGSNTNLHRHSVYVGPQLPQKRRELSALWSIVGLPARRRRELLRFVRKFGLRDAWNQLLPEERRFVSIKRAVSFQAALAHALKYPGKFLSASTPERLAGLEVTFHKTRRFSTGGAFYNVKVERQPGEDSPIGSCPICGARLVEIVEPWTAVFTLEAEGRRAVQVVRREIGQAKVFSGAGPP